MPDFDCSGMLVSVEDKTTAIKLLRAFIASSMEPQWYSAESILRDTVLFLDRIGAYPEKEQKDGHDN